MRCKAYARFSSPRRFVASLLPSIKSADAHKRVRAAVGSLRECSPGEGGGAAFCALHSGGSLFRGRRSPLKSRTHRVSHLVDKSPTKVGRSIGQKKCLFDRRRRSSAYDRPQANEAGESGGHRSIASPRRGRPPQRAGAVGGVLVDECARALRCRSSVARRSPLVIGVEKADKDSECWKLQQIERVDDRVGEQPSNKSGGAIGDLRPKSCRSIPDVDIILTKRWNELVEQRNRVNWDVEDELHRRQCHAASHRLSPFLVRRSQRLFGLNFERKRDLLFAAQNRLRRDGRKTFTFARKAQHGDVGNHRANARQQVGKNASEARSSSTLVRTRARGRRRRRHSLDHHDPLEQLGVDKRRIGRAERLVAVGQRNKSHQHRRPNLQF